jgi:hypothetical protein
MLVLVHLRHTTSLFPETYQRGTLIRSPGGELVQRDVRKEDWKKKWKMKEIRRMARTRE